MLVTNLWHGFDFGKYDQFFLIIDRIINEKSTVDVTASALRPLLTVKGLHTHSHFNTAEGDTGQWAENQSMPDLWPPLPPPPSKEENQGSGLFLYCLEIHETVKIHFIRLADLMYKIWGAFPPCFLNFIWEKGQLGLTTLTNIFW